MNNNVKALGDRARISVNSASGSNRKKQVMAAAIGNLLEYYDFVVYAFLATTISKKFFPVENEVAALLATFAVFGVGFVARPAGAAIIGRFGDVQGRKEALVITIFGMAIGTIGIGVTPSYQTIGVAAPILLVFLRLIQGVAAGGEWGSANAFLVETAPSGRRGLFGSFGQAAIIASTLLASGVVAIFTQVLSPQQMDDWGWRIPFLLGGLLLPVGVYMRRNIEETPAFLEAQKQPAKVAHDLGSPISMMTKAFGFTIVWTVATYIMLTYMPTFLVKHAGLSATEALWCNVFAVFTMVIAIPLFGVLSDRIGRKPLLLTCCVAFLVLPYPLFSIIVSHPSLLVVVLCLTALNLSIACFSGAGPAALAELFPTHARTTLMSIGYSLAVAIFGGFAPFVATWLISATGSPLAPTAYLILAGAVSGLVIWTFRETAHEKLR